MHCAARVSLNVMSDTSRVNQILESLEQGDPKAAEELLPAVYAELRQLAAARMSDERTGHTLAPTALVHEAYMRLVQPREPQQWNGRGHFFAAAAEAMRRILIEHARKRNAAKRGGEAIRVQWDSGDLFAPSRAPELIALDESLDRLEEQDADAALIVKLRFFAGLTIQQAAEQLGVSSRKADMLWAYARAWLRRDMDGDEA